MNNLKYFQSSFLVVIFGAIAGYFIGGFEALFLVFVLSILEISLSFDNAVVNAAILKDMEQLWRKRFLTWGILIAVFGMRIVFPIILVSLVALVSPWSALSIAINNPLKYQILMESAHVSLMGFGGAFLMLVGLHFFLNNEKKVHWFDSLERFFLSIAKIRFAAEIITVVAILSIGNFWLPDADKYIFMSSGVLGIFILTTIEKLTKLLEGHEENRALESTKIAAKSGFGMFIYLEVLDASFSFDGVIGAFAITSNLFIIAIGLGIGAMFVRSFTIFLVEKNSLEEYLYLEHGAFYAIIALAIIMFLSTFIHIPEVITGCIGAGFIAVAFSHSLFLRKKEK